MADCLSAAMGSIPVRTANEAETMLDGVMATYHRLTVMFSVLPIAIGMSLATIHVGFSLMDKASVCATEEQGSPDSYRDKVNQYDQV